MGYNRELLRKNQELIKANKNKTDIARAVEEKAIADGVLKRRAHYTAPVDDEDFKHDQKFANNTSTNYFKNDPDNKKSGITLASTEYSKRLKPSTSNTSTNSTSGNKGNNPSKQRLRYSTDLLSPDEIGALQKKAGLKQDKIIGPLTEAWAKKNNVALTKKEQVALTKKDKAATTSAANAALRKRHQPSEYMDEEAEVRVSPYANNTKTDYFINNPNNFKKPEEKEEVIIKVDPKKDVSTKAPDKNTPEPGLAASKGFTKEEFGRFEAIRKRVEDGQDEFTAGIFHDMEKRKEDDARKKQEKIDISNSRSYNSN